MATSFPTGVPDYTSQPASHVTDRDTEDHRGQGACPGTTNHFRGPSSLLIQVLCVVFINRKVPTHSHVDVWKFKKATWSDSNLSSNSEKIKGLGNLQNKEEEQLRSDDLSPKTKPLKRCLFSSQTYHSILTVEDYPSGPLFPCTHWALVFYIH